MKKTTLMFLFVSIVAVFLTSCANDKEEKVKNFVKIIENTENGVAEHSVFTYHENQIISADNTKQRIDYTYKEGFITKIVSYNKESKSSKVFEYTYLKEKLVKVTTSENDVIYYTHKSDGTVYYEKYNDNSQNPEQKIYHGTLFFKNKNLVKDERVFDDVGPNKISSSKTTFEYDAFHNPYCAILGYDKLLDQSILVSKNNVVMTVTETTVVEAGQTISSANLYKSIFKYDTDNYPTEQVSESSISNPNYSKIEYLY